MKIPSESEVAPRYKLLTVLTLLTMLPPLTLLNSFVTKRKLGLMVVLLWASEHNTDWMSVGLEIPLRLLCLLLEHLRS